MSRRVESLADPARAEAEQDQPSSTAAVHRGYLDQAVIGYIVYGVGAVTAFLAVKLALSDAQAGLHSSALAVGMVVAALVSHRLDRRLGMRVVHFIALGALGSATVLLAWAPAVWATLFGAAAVGIGTGLVLGHINQIMAAGGGALTRVRIARSTLVAMLTSVTVPVIIGLGVAIGVGWELAMVPALVVVAVALVATRKFEERPMVVVAHGYRLPGAFWLAWVLVVLFIAVEFATVFWGSTLVERRTGVSLEEATLVISAFVGGIIVGRIGLSSHAVSGRDPVWLMRGGIVLAMLGLLLPWASTSFEPSMAGMFLAGVGLGMLYPLGASITLATVPEHAQLASARLVLASGLAILLAPFVLGVVAEVTGVVAAWLLIPGLCLASLALSVPVGRGRQRRDVGPVTVA